MHVYFALTVTLCKLHLGAVFVESLPAFFASASHTAATTRALLMLHLLPLSSFGFTLPEKNSTMIIIFHACWLCAHCGKHLEFGPDCSACDKIHERFQFHVQLSIFTYL